MEGEANDEGHHGEHEKEDRVFLQYRDDLRIQRNGGNITSTTRRFFWGGRCKRMFCVVQRRIARDRRVPEVPRSRMLQRENEGIPILEKGPCQRRALETIPLAVHVVVAGIVGAAADEGAKGRKLVLVLRGILEVLRRTCSAGPRGRRGGHRPCGQQPPSVVDFQDQLSDIREESL